MMSLRMNKRYSELIRIPSFEERFDYLKIPGRIGESTFGFDRYLNQAFYSSKEWKNFRRNMILRDDACDMALPDRPISGNKLILHHINPISIEDINERSDILMDPENVVCVAYMTHQAIHFGDISLIAQLPIERHPNDTSPWKLT